MNSDDDFKKLNSSNVTNQDPTQDISNLTIDQPLLLKKNKVAISEDPTKNKSHMKFKARYEVKDHLKSLEQLSIEYHTHIDSFNPNASKGLTKDQAREKQEFYGKNVLSPPKQKSELEKFLAHLLNMFNLLLAGAGVLSFVAYALEPDQPVNMYLGIFLFGIVMADCIIGYIQERSSSNVMGKFKNMLPPRCRVVRDGGEDEIKAEELVVGDIVKVQGGDKIPADLRVIVNQGLKVEQSALNGESEPVEISEKSLHDDFLESKNIIFNGCLCLEGMAKGVVIKTGDNTFLGIVAQQTAQIDQEETPLQKEVGKFVKLIGVLGLTMGAIVFSIGCIRYAVKDGSDHSTYLHLFVNGFIIIIIANVPQGLPATVILCLTIIAKRMANKQVFVKKLECIETLGSASVIASDKTGTLTMNKMTVEHLWFDGQLFSSELVKSSARELKNNMTWNIMFKVASLCNKAFLKKPSDEEHVDHKNNVEDKDSLLLIQELGSDKSHRNLKKTFNNKQSNVLLEEYKKSTGSFIGGDVNLRKLSLGSDDLLDDLKKINNDIMKSFLKEKEKRRNFEMIGDASEQALLRFCEDFKNTDLYKLKYPKLFEVPFNSKNKYQLSIHETHDKRFVVMKGAPEIIVKRCSSYMHGHKTYPIDEHFETSFKSNYGILGRKGERVLGCAYLDLGVDKTHYSLIDGNYPQNNLVFIGLYSLMDPPKKGVAEAITIARNAGIKVFMVTGDHPLTAEAIARKVGIIQYGITVEDIARKRKCDVELVDPSDATAAIVYGPNMEKFTREDWDDLLLGKQEIVFARITPQQKVEIVQNLQERDEKVIVTGDGVNDAIALKKADIGVAMGRGGSDVAKEAADVLFMDDDFASIVMAIKEGRTLFDNLKKAIAYTLCHCILELAPILLNVALDLPLGFASLQMLSVDLGTELAPAISLAYEKTEDDIMDRPPRNCKKDSLVSFRLLSYSYLQAGVIQVFWCFVAYFLTFSLNSRYECRVSPSDMYDLSSNYFNDNPIGPYGGCSVHNQQVVLSQVQTAWYVTVVLGQFSNIWMCKTRQMSLFQHGIENPMTIYGVVIEIMILMLIVFVPGLQGVFNTNGEDVISRSDYALYFVPWVGILVSLWVFCESRKWWTRKYPTGKVAKLLMW